jgi:hypothetical protein
VTYYCVVKETNNHGRVLRRIGPYTSFTRAWLRGLWEVVRWIHRREWVVVEPETRS